MANVRVNITTLDGTLLESAIVTSHHDSNDIELAADILGLITMRHETDDENMECESAVSLVGKLGAGGAS